MPTASGPPTGLTIFPVTGLGEISEGDDLATAILAQVALRDGDVVVVAQKIVSKSEGAVVAVPSHEATGDPRRQLAREQAARVVADTPEVLVVQTRHGFVCANAGIDASNAAPGTLILLPDDPDASARRLRAGLNARSRARVAVIISDTFGRPWRAGQTDVAIGVAGIGAIRDERGGVDRFGRPLEVTQVAIIDELAAAADLVRRKADGVPVVVVRGLIFEPDEEAGAGQLVRDRATDLFLRGRGELASAMRSPTPLLLLDDAGLRRSIESARTLADDAVRFSIDRTGGSVRIRPWLDAARTPGERSASVEPSTGPGSHARTAATLGAAAALLLAVLVDGGYAGKLVLHPDPVVVVSRSDVA